MTSSRLYRFLTLLFIFPFLPVSVTLAAPTPDLWPVWQAHDPQSVLEVNYQDWGSFLAKYVSTGPDNSKQLAYHAVSPADQKDLNLFLTTLATTPVSRLTRSQQKAFWINLYNALTVQVILEHYPVDSIRDIDISPGFFSDGPWGKKLLRIEGREVSLDDIEHRILRPIFQDNRIHYALNCASIGCPQLQPVPFTAENMEDMLNRAANEYINHPRAVNISKGRLVVSSIYKWFQQDFGANQKEVIDHLQTYADEDLRQKLGSFSRINGYHYDWSLNQSRQ